MVVSDSLKGLTVAEMRNYCTFCQLLKDLLARLKRNWISQSIRII